MEKEKVDNLECGDHLDGNIELYLDGMLEKEKVDNLECGDHLDGNLELYLDGKLEKDVKLEKVPRKDYLEVRDPLDSFLQILRFLDGMLEWVDLLMMDVGERMERILD